MRKICGLFLIFVLTAAILTAGEIVKYPGVEIDLAKKEVRVEARLSAELLWGEPVLEFILMRGAERGYETLFLTRADPAHVQLGLVMLGLRPQPQGNNDEPTPGGKTPDKSLSASLVDILVSWQTAGGRKTLPVEKFLANRRVGKPALAMPFQFTGSYQYNNDEGKSVLAASSSGIFVALLRNPIAVCNLPYFEPSPYGDELAGFAVPVDRLPPEMLTTKTIDVADDNGVPRPTKRLVPKDIPVQVVFRISGMPWEKAVVDPYLPLLKK